VGINKELKASQKRVCQTYPIQVGEYSLLYFRHAKVEASSLKDISLSSTEFKRHDPHNVVKNHFPQFGTKEYFHEYYPLDDIFKGVNIYDEFLSRIQNIPEKEKSKFLNIDDIFKGVNIYDEVLSRIQNILDKEKSKFLNFRKHGRSCFPNSLQAEQSLTHNGNPTSEVLPSANHKEHHFPEVKTKEVDKTNTSSKDTTMKEPTLPGKTLQKTIAMFQDFMKHGNVFPQITSNIETTLNYSTTQGESNCWHPIQFFLLSYKMPTPMSSELQIVVASFE
jgi:hypothetical protein